MEELLTSLPSDLAFRNLIVSALREEHINSSEEGKLKRNYEMIMCRRQFESGVMGDDLMDTLKTFTSDELKSMISNDKATLLHYAARHGWKEILKTLITTHNFDPMCKDANGLTAAHYAAKGKQYDVFEMMVNEYKCDPMCKDNRNQIPLYYAIESGCLDILKGYTFLQHDGNVYRPSTHLPLYTLATTHDTLTIAIHTFHIFANIAAENGHLHMLEYLVTECKCDVEVFDSKCKTPLHYAAQRGRMDMVRFLISKCKCDANAYCHNFESCSNSKYPLHFAAEYGHIDVVKFLLSDECKCKADCTTSNGITPLHLAAENGHKNIVECLISECNCNASCITNQGLTPLHYACAEFGCIDIVKYLISCQGYADWRTNDGLIPLHYASKYGHCDIVKFLVSRCQCVAHCTTSEEFALEYDIDLVKCIVLNTTDNGFTPLHFASRHGHFDIVKFLVSECQCVVGCTANDGFTTPLYCASEGGHFSILEFLLEVTSDSDQNMDHCFEVSVENKHSNIAKYLIKEYNCQPMTLLTKAICERNYDQVEFLVRVCNVDPSLKDELGKTPLHYAVQHVHLKIIECLVFTGLVDFEAKDNNNETPFQLADKSKHRKEILELYYTFNKAIKSFPVHSYVNIFFLGNSGAGKSTLCQVIIDTVSTPLSTLNPRQVKGVKPFTAGIIPTKLKHKKLGNIIIHDLAGHSEYYGSHTAIIENLLKTSNAIFVIVVDASEKEVMTHLHQWLMIVTNESKKTASVCKILVVVSHDDLLHNSGDLLKKMHAVLDSKHTCIPCHSLDCRKLGGKRMKSFFSTLHDSCESIRTESTKTPLTYYCHMMYSLLDEVDKNVLSLIDIAMATVKNIDRFVLPYDNGKEILKTLSSLHSTGLIYYINEEDDDDDKDVLVPFMSGFRYKMKSLIWVVKNKQALFTEVNGRLFAPEHFKEYSNITQDGIVSVSVFKSIFPDLDCAMLVCFLLDSKLCNIMPYPFLQRTNLKCKDNDPANSFRLFFPSLVKQETPNETVSKGKYVFGWCLQCKGPYQFFPSHFLHFLSLQLAYKYAVAEHGCIKSNDLQCCFWKSGVHWFNGKGVGTLVEVVNEKRCVVVMMSCEEGYEDEMVSLRRKVIRDVIKCQEKVCSNFTVQASVIDCESLQYPINCFSDRMLYCVENIIRALNENRTHVIGSTFNSSNTCQGEIKNILPHEGLSEPSKISILGNDEGDDYSTSCTYMSTSNYYRPLDIKNLVDVLDALEKRALFSKDKWFELGLKLGLYYNTLKEIQADHSSSGVSQCLRETIAAWLNGQDNVLKRESKTWASLATALHKMGEKTAASQIQKQYELS